MNTFKRLENWKKKENYIVMEIGTSYGATCWEITLSNVLKKKRVIMSECSFYTCWKEPPFESLEKDGWTNIIGFVCYPDMEDWPGLEATINAAIDLAEEKEI